MKHIKPGRGPSTMGVIGAVAAAVFGIFWTAIAPGFIKAFGVIFIVIAIAQAVYHFKNAASKNRFSAFDITDSNEEPDPLNQRFHASDTPHPNQSAGARFCPYCGAAVEADHLFCRSCGKRMD